MAKLEIICGPMFCGKSEELIRRLRRMQIAHKKIVTFKPSIDTRYDKNCISSHTGAKIEAITIDIKKPEKMLGYITDETEVIGIDEIQFFDNSVINVIDGLIEREKDIIVAGLDKDFRKEPFGPIASLLAKADYVTKLDAVCMKCGSSATLTQRIVNGKPAKYGDPVTLIGEKDKYEARCRKCHEIEK